MVYPLQPSAQDLKIKLEILFLYLIKMFQKKLNTNIVQLTSKILFTAPLGAHFFRPLIGPDVTCSLKLKILELGPIGAFDNWPTS